METTEITREAPAIALSIIDKPSAKGIESLVLRLKSGSHGGSFIHYSARDIHHKINNGLSGAALNAVKRLYGINNEKLGRLIGIRGDKTVAKRLAAKQISPIESDRVWRLIRLYSEALIALDGDKPAATQWFHTPAIRLGGEVPLELLQTEEGAKLVSDALVAIDYGLPV